MQLMASRRKQVQREPNGREQRHKSYSPVEIRRVRDAAMRGMRDPEWGTEFGRMCLDGRISDEMYGAGKRWAYDAAQYQAAMGTAPARSAAMELGVRAEPPDPDSDEGRKQNRRERDAIESYRAARAMLEKAGPDAEKVVRRLCEDGESLAGYVEYLAARRGLSALAAHYALTNRRK